MDPLTMALIAAGGSAIGALPDIIPSKYERDQKKRLKEMQRKQEMGALGLTKAERDAIEGQMRGARRQAQQYADAERARLTQPTAQPQMALLGQQMADEGRQRLEADLASQILGMDLSRQAEQEQEIKDLEAAQAQYRRARLEGITAPFQVGAETYVGQMGMDRLLGVESPQRSIDLDFLQGRGQLGQGISQGIASLGAQRMLAERGRTMGMTAVPTMQDLLAMAPEQQYVYMSGDLGLSDDEIAQYFANIGSSKSIDRLADQGTFDFANNAL